MNIINVRSPFVVSVNGDATQTKTKVELYIYAIGDTLPTDPTKVIEKESFSPTQYIGNYNISPFVADYLIPSDGCNNSISTNLKFAYNVQVKTYYFTDDWYLITSYDYVGVYGYNDFNTQNFSDIESYKILYNDLSQIFYYKKDSNNPYIDILMDFDLHPYYRIIYRSLDFANEYVNDLSESGIYADKFQLLPPAYSYFDDGHFFNVEYSDDNTTWTSDTQDIQVMPICENKYQPYILYFNNRLGGMQPLYFFKNSTTEMEVKGSEYNSNTFTTYPNYNKIEGQTRLFNRNGRKSITLNTGWISESNNANIEDIMLSENLVLVASNSLDMKAVKLKDSNVKFKTHLNDKVINYTMTFEIVSNLVNNVI